MRTSLTSRGPRPGLHCFTIIEMIWVLVVVLIIASMTFGIFQSLNTRKGAEGGARMLSRQLFLCRDYALLKRKRVALLIPQGDEITSSFTSTHGPVGVTEDGNHYALAMRPCFLTSSNTFDSWVPNTKWEFVPNRVRIDVRSAGLTTVTDNFGTGSSHTISAIIYQPNGSLNTASDISGIKVTNGADTTYELQVNWLTGKASFVDN